MWLNVIFGLNIDSGHPAQTMYMHRTMLSIQPPHRQEESREQE